MESIITLALAHGWPDDAIAELECYLANKNMAAAITLIRAQDMQAPERQQLKALVVLAIVS